MIKISSTKDDYTKSNLILTGHTDLASLMFMQMCGLKVKTLHSKIMKEAFHDVSPSMYNSVIKRD